MPVPSYIVRCTKKELIAPAVYELRFAKPDGFVFTAGQFILFDVPLLDTPTDVQTRAFSIASAPAESELVFVVKLKEGGRASNWIEKSVDTGSEVRFQGPFGLFTLKPDDPKPYLFVCTGTGVAPFRSQLKFALEESGDKRKMELIFGVRNRLDLFWVDEFMNLMQRFPNFRFHISLTSGEPDWDGHRGRVQEVIPQIAPDLRQWKVYICGAPDMVTDVKKKCLEEWGMEKRDVHAEGYI